MKKFKCPEYVPDVTKKVFYNIGSTWSRRVNIRSVFCFFGLDFCLSKVKFGTVYYYSIIYTLKTKIVL